MMGSMEFTAGNKSQMLPGKHGLDTCSQSTFIYICLNHLADQIKADSDSVSDLSPQTSRRYPETESQAEGGVFSAYRSATLKAFCGTAEGTEW